MLVGHTASNPSEVTQSKMPHRGRHQRVLTLPRPKRAQRTTGRAVSCYFLVKSFPGSRVDRSGRDDCDGDLIVIWPCDSRITR